ncbi:MAG: T9SS type A sorting domain-containing protein [Chitinophagales bacterium]|jgi:hypothetical protein
MKNNHLLVLLSLVFVGPLLFAQTNTTYKYDAMQRITEARFSDGGFETYSYDKVGNRKSFIKVIPIDTLPAPSAVHNSEPDIFKIYPNPTDGVFSLEGSLLTPSDAVLKIFDLSGREILSQTIPKSSKIKQELDISRYTSGNYLFVIQYGDRKRSWNIIKQ